MVTIRNLGEYLILLTLIIKQMKNLILHKETLTVLCTFLKTVASYIISITLDERDDSIQTEASLT